ncbi:MAG: DUF1194 domain-containing protein [Geminicoccaceae bacterium]|nr:DUF1194 domain-containing protein [Geminicoccaceae bacterium]
MAILLLGRDGAVAAEPTLSSEVDPFVCAQTVIAVDASESTESSAFDRQRQALSDAFRHPRLAAAVQDCLPGSFGVAVLTWAGPGDQRVCAPWTVLRSAEDLAGFAPMIEGCTHQGGTTDIGSAVDAALDLLERSPLMSHYRIVYLLTNGRTNDGAELRLELARQAVERQGVTLAGHALLHRAVFWKAPRTRHDPFRRWVEIEVTAGPRSFTGASEPGEDAREILNALVRMLRQELQ